MPITRQLWESYCQDPFACRCIAAFAKGCHNSWDTNTSWKESERAGSRSATQLRAMPGSPPSLEEYSRLAVESFLVTGGAQL